jgi:hypothetical protein
MLRKHPARGFFFFLNAEVIKESKMSWALSTSLGVYLNLHAKRVTISRDSHFKAKVQTKIVSLSLRAVCGGNTIVGTTLDKDPLSASLVLFLPCIISYRTISRDSHLFLNLCAVCGGNTTVATTLDKDPLKCFLSPIPSMHKALQSRETVTLKQLFFTLSVRSMRRQHHCGDHPGQRPLKCYTTKIPFMYSFSGNCVASAPISTFMFL